MGLYRNSACDSQGSFTPTINVTVFVGIIFNLFDVTYKTAAAAYDCIIFVNDRKTETLMVRVNEALET